LIFSEVIFLGNKFKNRENLPPKKNPKDEHALRVFFSHFHPFYISKPCDNTLLLFTFSFMVIMSIPTPPKHE
jgi:hypothetical protein